MGHNRHEPEASRPKAPPSYRFPTSPEGMPPWSHAAERLEQAQNYWLATTRPDGRSPVVSSGSDPVRRAWSNASLEDGTRWRFLTSEVGTGEREVRRSIPFQRQAGTEPRATSV